MSAAELLRATGLVADGPAVVGRPLRAPRPGVYVIELAAPLERAPVDLGLVGRWIERVPSLRLDGEPPVGKALAGRLAAFWLPSRTVVYIGRASGSVAGRVQALHQHVLGDPRPHAASHWLKALRVDALRVWWATTDAPDEYEDALLDAFAASVPEADRAKLPAGPVLPFANLRTATGERKPTGITGSTLPAEVDRPVPAGRVVDLPPGDADGARVEARGTGTTRRAAAPARRPAAGRTAAGPRRAATPRSDTRRAATPPAPSPADLEAATAISADGLARLEAEHTELVGKRPEVVARIRAAKELGDLKENSDYTAAREEQGFLEGRIQAIEARLRTAVVVTPPADGDRITIGSTIEVDIDGAPRRITIVGRSEASAAAGRISIDSPIGRALLGARAGDEVVATAPGGAVPLRVLAIE